MTTPRLDEPTALRTPVGLRAWRLEHKLSQPALGELLDVRLLTISRWENGKTAIPRTVELALLWLDRELGTTPSVVEVLSPGDELILELCRERGDDVDSYPSSATLVAFRHAHDNDADIDAACRGNRLAMIRVRKAAGLRAFR